MSNKTEKINANVQNTSKVNNTSAKNTNTKNTNVKNTNTKNTNTKNTNTKNTNTKNTNTKNTNVNNTNVKNTNNSEKQKKLNSDIDTIIPLLSKLSELQKKYEISTVEEQGSIENEFNTIKDQVIQLQSSINKNIEDLSIDTNIIQLFNTSYPDYFKALTDLYVVNIKAINNAVSKNNSANGVESPVEKKNTNHSGGKRKTLKRRRTRKH